MTTEKKTTSNKKVTSHMDRFNPIYFSFHLSLLQRFINDLNFCEIHALYRTKKCLFPMTSQETLLIWSPFVDATTAETFKKATPSCLVNLRRYSGFSLNFFHFPFGSQK
jgi:hypothetical protein